MSKPPDPFAFGPLALLEKSSRERLKKLHAAHPNRSGLFDLPSICPDVATRLSLFAQ